MNSSRNTQIEAVEMQAYGRGLLTEATEEMKDSLTQTLHSRKWRGFLSEEQKANLVELHERLMDLGVIWLGTAVWEEFTLTVGTIAFIGADMGQVQSVPIGWQESDHEWVCYGGPQHIAASGFFCFISDFDPGESLVAASTMCLSEEKAKAIFSAMKCKRQDAA